MPAVVPFIPLIIAGATAGTEIGMTAAGVGQPSTGDATKQLQQAQEAQARADREQKTRAIQASLANAQEQGGGALSAPSLTDLASVIAGFPGESSTSAGTTALNKYLGLNPNTGTSTGLGGDTMVGSTFGLSGTQG